MTTWHPPAWVSVLAEELAELARKGDVAGLSAGIHRGSVAHGGFDKWLLTQMVAAEWARAGIITIPAGGPALPRIKA